MPGVLDYAFNPQWAHRQDEIQRLAEIDRQQVNSVADAYNTAYTNPAISQQNEQQKLSEQVLANPGATFISNLLNSGNAGASKYGMQLQQQQMGRTPKDNRVKWDRYTDDTGNTWLIDPYDPSSKQMIHGAAPEPAPEVAEAKNPFGTGMKAGALQIVMDPNIPADDPIRIGARRVLQQGSWVPDAQTGENVYRPGMDLQGVDPYITESNVPKFNPGRSKLQKDYDEKATAAIPVIDSYNTLYEAFDALGARLLPGPEKKQLESLTQQLVGDVQKLEEFGVLNEADVIHIKNIIGDPNDLASNINEQNYRSKMDAVGKYIKRRVDTKLSPFDRYDDLQKLDIPELYKSPKSKKRSGGPSARETELDAELSQLRKRMTEMGVK